jgi:hypothetical protein
LGRGSEKGENGENVRETHNDEPRVEQGYVGAPGFLFGVKSSSNHI